MRSKGTAIHSLQPQELMTIVRYALFSLMHFFDCFSAFLGFRSVVCSSCIFWFAPILLYLDVVEHQAQKCQFVCVRVAGCV
jgi:F0F1-type ATP synthase assembly protein I